jgi:hypothetical protein
MQDTALLQRGCGLRMFILRNKTTFRLVKEAIFLVHCNSLLLPTLHQDLLALRLHSKLPRLVLLYACLDLLHVILHASQRAS